MDKVLAGSPYWLERVKGLDLAARARQGQLSHLLLNQPPVCNSHCRRCFMPEHRRNSTYRALSAEESFQLIDEASKAGMLCMEISGEGEPLLSKELRRIIDYAHDRGLTTTLITNGHAIKEALVNFLAERDVTLVVSLFSLEKEKYEHDNGVPGSFERIVRNLKMAADRFSPLTRFDNGVAVYRMAVHATAQVDNQGDLFAIREFCATNGIFFSVAPLADSGNGGAIRDLMLSNGGANDATALSDNSIILSQTSASDVGREVCGTCLYGLNIGYEGSLLLDVHSGYELEGRLGNIRTHSIKELIATQQRLAPFLFHSIKGFCPVRDPEWPDFLASLLQNEQLHQVRAKAV